MTEKQLKEAQQVSYEMSTCQRDIDDIDIILEDFDNFGSKVEFIRNSDGFSRSFGSKKHGVREQLNYVLSRIREAKVLEVATLKDKFEKI